MKFSFSTVEQIIYLLGIYLVIHAKSKETKNILYYGWFLDEETAKSLQSLTTDYFNEYIQNSTEFKNFLESAVRNSSLGSSPLNEYYTKPVDPNTKEFDPLYHVTAKFCGGMDNCPQYSDLDVVEKNTNKIFNMELIGWFFTNRTYGIRVDLSDEQKELYKPDGGANLGTMFNENIETTQRSNYQNYPNIEFEAQELNLTPSNSIAHITIGCAPGIPAQITGDDLGEIIMLEWDADVERTNISFENALMVQYGKWDAFVVYPNNKIKTKATFKPYYMHSGGNNKNVNSFLILFSVATIAYYMQ